MDNTDLKMVVETPEERRKRFLIEFENPSSARSVTNVSRRKISKRTQNRSSFLLIFLYLSRSFERISNSTHTYVNITK